MQMTPWYFQNTNYVHDYILHKEQKLQYRLTVIICIRPDVKVGVLQKNAINAFGYLTQERDSDGKVIFSSNET